MDRKIGLQAMLVCCSLAFVHAAQGQTYFYINGVAVLPAAPTDQDDVRLLLHGDLSNTASWVTGASAQVDGYTLSLTVNTQGDMGIDVLVPHTETVPAGMLAPGTYTVVIGGSGVLDSAPAQEHQFTVAGGEATACDSLIIASVEWAPFSDTTLLVHVFNPTSELFDYPGFVLLDANGDTLARETVDFFGIAQESWHVLAIQPGATVPEGPFTGTLELWTWFHAELSCTWNTTFDLCPPGPCAPLTAYIHNISGNPADGSFQYTVRHMGEVVATGLFVLTPDNQYDSDSLCLPPGNYLMEVVADQGPSGSQPRFGVSLGNAVQGPSAPVEFTTLSAVPFNFLAPCADGTQGVAERQPAALALACGNGMASVARSDGRALGDLRVYDGQGRMVFHVDEQGTSYQWATAGWPAGLYLVCVEGADHDRLAARWVVQ